VNELGMRTAEQEQGETRRSYAVPESIGTISKGGNPCLRQRGRLLGCLGFCVLLTAAFIKPLCSLAAHSVNTGLDSYILLVPLISAFVIFARRKQFPAIDKSSPLFATVFLGGGLAALAGAWILGAPAAPISHNDYLALMTLSFVSLLTATGFAFLGAKWMISAAFPIAFLIFMVPLPDQAVVWLETAYKFASADAAQLFFSLSGTPVSRDGTVFQLPGILFEVAQECSGINSSLALFITSLVASYMLLKSPWRRALLVAFVIPLGILRNGFRILVIGLLCVHVGPQMIHSIIHTHGGPLFFALSLIPLVLLLGYLRSQEVRTHRSGISAQSDQPLDSKL
jgi:exosortase C (VPDSG-CTERM-specific)